MEKKLETNFTTGLTAVRVLEIQQRDGKNIFKRGARISFWQRLFSHLKNPLIFILLIAGEVTLLLQYFLDTIIIFSVVIINLSIGLFQENKADKAFEKLNAAQKTYATVLRDGKQKVVAVEELTRGDIVLLTAGVSVPADLRIIEENDLLINEAALTGEWLGVSKNSRSNAQANLAIAEQSNMAWMGTSVSEGFGKGVVVEIGATTQLGQISEQLSEFDEITPLRRKMNKLVRFLSIMVFVIITVIFFLGVWQGEDYTDMFVMAVAVAVSVIPQGLPVAFVSVLAVGMKEILKKGGLIKNLLASETLGNVSVILTDKTGTITQAKMKLERIIALKDNADDEKEVLRAAVICSDAFLEKDEKIGEGFIVRGRPLEKAVVTAGLEQGILQGALEKDNQRLDLILFESQNGYATSLNHDGADKRKVYINGRPEIVLEKSKFVFKNGKIETMTEADRKYFQRILQEQTNQGARLTAVAFKSVDWKKIPNNGALDADLVFGGMLVFSDPIREDVFEAVKTAKEMGTRVIMLTGDNPGTARKIAEEAGIITHRERVLEGSDIDKMGDVELGKVLDKVKVFARMSPAQKLRISKILKDAGEITAMTGDGINDAPALRNANVGIAVESGTEVAKESADMILLGDSFSIIVSAIEEGRRIIDNMKKIIAYLLSTSFSEVFVIMFALLLGLPLPILASQVLFINVVGEGLMSFAFVFEPLEKYSRQKNYYLDDRSILTSQLKKIVLSFCLIAGMFLATLYFVLITLEFPIDRIRTIMFVAFSFDSLFFALAIKSFRKSIWQTDLASNKFLVFAWVSSSAVVLAALFIPFMRTL
ncbi:MAG: HAD-IC family P-type ATPase, partial [Proteobacteria bacterium]|nr:HAD-IC family P-type ATPase [Pseudomonadota bacterium]